MRNTLKKLADTKDKISEYEQTDNFPLAGLVDKFDIVKLVNSDGKCAVAKIETLLWNVIGMYPFQVVKQHLDGDMIILTGYIDADTTINGILYKLSIADKPDIFIAKINIPTGAIVFFKTIPSIGKNTITQMIVANNGIYLMGQYFDSITFGNIYLTHYIAETDYLFVAKFDMRLLEWIWAQNLQATGIDAIFYNETPLKPLNGNLLIAGSFKKSVIFDTIPKTELKVDDEFWEDDTTIGYFLSYMNANNGEWHEITKIEEDKPIGKFIFVADTLVFIQNDKIIYKFNHKLVEIGQTEHMNILHQIAKDNRNNYYAFYWDGQTKILAKYDNNWNMRWATSVAKHYTDIVVDNQYHIYLCGVRDISTLEICKLNGVGTMLKKYNCSTKLTAICGVKIIPATNEIVIAGIQYDRTVVIVFTSDDRDKHCLGQIKNISATNVKTNINGMETETAEVFFRGKISTGYGDLKSAYDYYIQTDGTLDIASNDYYFGTAISESKMLIP